MIGAAAIGGLLLIFQIRMVNDAVNSAKAIFAADTGIELVALCEFKGCDPDPLNDPQYDAENPPPINFEDSSVSFDTDREGSSSTISITSRGRSGNAIRILNSIFIFE